MACPICGDAPRSMILIKPINYTICSSCYEGARGVMAMMNKKDNDNTSKGFSSALKWVKDVKETEEELKEKVAFLAGFADAFRDQIHTDIPVWPDRGGSIPAHRALLAARSKFCRDKLESDSIKVAPPLRFKLYELNHEELQAFLEFLYSGNLPRETMEKHVYSLSFGADEYQVPFLQKFCDHHMLRNLNTDSALVALEVACLCSRPILKKVALMFIVRNMRDIIFSPKFYDFVLKFPRFGVKIARASCWKPETLDMEILESSEKSQYGIYRIRS